MTVWTNRDSHWTADRGLLLGDGVFETLLVMDGVAQDLEPHVGRLRRSASAFGIEVPDELGAPLAGLVDSLWSSEGRPVRASLRITLSRGAGRGLDAPSRAEPRLILALEPCAPPAGPASAVVVDRPRIDPSSPMAGHKTLSHLAYVVARAAARRDGADMALLRTLEGDVCEADAANLFVVLDGTTVTPPLDRGVLPGITRARCLDVLARERMPFEERPVELDDLAAASEVFVTSSLAGLHPISRVGASEHPAPGPVCLRLGTCVELPRTD